MTYELPRLVCLWRRRLRLLRDSSGWQSGALIRRRSLVRFQVSATNMARMHHTGSKGDIGVARVTADLIESGYHVLMPVDSTSPFDLVTHRDGVFTKIQVKYRSLTDGVIAVEARRAIISNSKRVRRDMTVDEADVIAVYCPETKLCYYIPMGKFSASGFNLRVESPKNGQSQGINWAKDFVGMPAIVRMPALPQ